METLHVTINRICWIFGLLVVLSGCSKSPPTVSVPVSTDLIKLSPCSFSYKSVTEERHKNHDKIYFVDLAPVALTSGNPRFLLKLPGHDVMYNPCFDYSLTTNNESCCARVAVCERFRESNSSDICTERGSQESVSVVSREDGTFSLAYTNQHNHLSAVVDLVCTQDAVPTLAVISEPGRHEQLRLALIGSISCPLLLDAATPVHSSLSVGSVVLLIGVVIFSVYFLGGMLLKRFCGGARGVEAVPHYEFWLDLPVLIKDGTTYLVNGCRPEVIYEQI